MAEEVKGGGYRTLGEQGEALGPIEILPERVDFPTPLMEIIHKVGAMKLAGVKPYPDGYYRAAITMNTLTKLYADPMFQRLNQSIPEGAEVLRGFVGHIAGIMFHVEGDVDSVTGGIGP